MFLVSAVRTVFEADPAGAGDEGGAEEVVGISSFIFCLQTELYCQSAQTYRRARYRMGVSFQTTEPDELNPCPNKKDGPDHSCDCNRSEYECYRSHTEPAARCGGIHQHRYQNLTRTKNENNEKRPWCNARLVPAVVNVGVFLVVTVLV
jgi:hypothetical protein